MKLKWHRLKFDRRRDSTKPFVLLVVTLFSIISLAQTKEIVPGESSGLVELELSADPDATYKQRRSTWSKRFSVSYEAMVPMNFESPIDGFSYESLYDFSHIPLLCVNFGVQYNSKVGAFFADFTYGGGTISNSSGTTGDQINLTKIGMNFGLLMDTIFENPYVSPFVSLQTILFNWYEFSSTSSSSMEGQTGLTVGFNFGVSLHLDRLDKKTSGRAYVEHGIKNSFLDIYASLYQPSMNADDPNFETSTNISAALRFEF